MPLEKLDSVASLGYNESYVIANSERLPWFKHDTGHVNMAFIDYDG